MESIAYHKLNTRIGNLENRYKAMSAQVEVNTEANQKTSD